MTIRQRVEELSGAKINVKKIGSGTYDVDVFGREYRVELNEETLRWNSIQVTTSAEWDGWINDHDTKSEAIDECITCYANEGSN